MCNIVWTSRRVAAVIRYKSYEMDDGHPQINTYHIKRNFLLNGAFSQMYVQNDTTFSETRLQRV